ncbi:MAG: hypothetical protein Q4C47_09540, partial [Planctomycetia bacterium]|nr:hypothetical protein [Planctomycetia bacterium]
LGWLNFSSDQEEEDVHFLRVTDQVFRIVARSLPSREKTHLFREPLFNGEVRPDCSPTQPSLWREFFRQLREELVTAQRDSQAFAQITQAMRILDLTEHTVLPAYRKYHQDLLFHQTDESLFQPFFVARTLEIVLRVLQTDGVNPDDKEKIAERAVTAMNDYLGYRPIPVLHNHQKMEPWPHEFFGVVPLWVAGAGVS